jgi:hypothetical protein
MRPCYHGLLGEASLKLCQTSEADPVAVFLPVASLRARVAL